MNCIKLLFSGGQIASRFLWAREDGGLNRVCRCTDYLLTRAAVACCAVRYFIVSHRRPVMSFMLKPQHPASPELVETRCTAPMSIGIRLPLTNTSLPTPGAPPETVGELDRAGELGEPAASGLHWSSRGRREELRLAIAGSSVTASSAAAISNQYSTILRQCSRSYGLVAPSARSRYSSALFRNSSAFDAMGLTPLRPV
jgi:hypothetical protein